MKPKQKPRVFCEFNKMFFDLETSTCMVFSFVKTFINGKKSSKVFANNLNKITKMLFYILPIEASYLEIQEKIINFISN